MYSQITAASDWPRLSLDPRCFCLAYSYFIPAKVGINSCMQMCQRMLLFVCVFGYMVELTVIQVGALQLYIRTWPWAISKWYGLTTSYLRFLYILNCFLKYFIYLLLYSYLYNNQLYMLQTCRLKEIHIYLQLIIMQCIVIATEYKESYSYNTDIVHGYFA